MVFEQIISSDTWQSTKSTLTSTSGMNKAILPLPEIQTAPLKQHTSPSPEIQATSAKRQRTTDEDALTKGCYLLYIFFQLASAMT